jgi:hypothetical protein
MHDIKYIFFSIKIIKHYLKVLFFKIHKKQQP